MVLIFQHKIFLLAFLLICLGIAAGLNGAFADETNQSVKDLKALVKASEKLSSDAINFDIPESYIDSPSRDHQADFDSLQKLQKQAEKQQKKLNQLKDELDKHIAGDPDLDRQVKAIQRNINKANKYINEKIQENYDVRSKDQKKRESKRRVKKKGRVKDRGDTVAVTTSADNAGTHKIDPKIPTPEFKDVNIPEIPAGPVCPEDKDALIDDAFDAELAAGDNARAAQSTVLAISRALSDGKGNAAALNKQLKVAKNVVKSWDAVWIESEKARKAAQGLETKNCDEKQEAKKGTTGKSGGFIRMDWGNFWRLFMDAQEPNNDAQEPSGNAGSLRNRLYKITHELGIEVGAKYPVDDKKSTKTGTKRDDIFYYGTDFKVLPYYNSILLDLNESNANCEPNNIKFNIEIKLDIEMEISRLKRLVDAEYEKAMKTPPGSDEEEKKAWSVYNYYLQQLLWLEGLRDKAEKAKKNDKTDRISSVIDQTVKEGDFGTTVGLYISALDSEKLEKARASKSSYSGTDDNDQNNGVNMPIMGSNDAARRLKETETVILGLPIPGLQNLSPGTNPADSVFLCEPNFVWKAQDPDQAAGLAKYIPEVGLEDQWGTKAIDWKSSLVPSGGSVIVAVIDSGVDYHNIQLKDAIWKNPDETLNGIDDDDNGYIDDIRGWNFFSDNNDPLDDYGHGTMIAGIIAARPTSGKGIFGVNPRAAIMNLKVMDKAGNVGTRDVARAIYYAANHGANVINLSLGGKISSFVVDAAIGYARRRGALVVVAAGNDAVDTRHYSSGSIGAIAVAATDRENKRLGISNWGHEVDIAAPGLDILSLRARGTDMLLQTGTVPYMIGDKEYWPWKKDGRDREREKYSPGKNIYKQGYYHATGTSFAAPFVSGVASLILSKHPGLTPEQIARMLLMSAKDIETPGWDQLTGYGLIDARAALEADPDFYVIARIDKIAAGKKDGKLVIQVFGTAAGSEFNQAWVELGFGENPKKWKKVKKMKKEVNKDLLAEIKPKAFNKRGTWSVRVTVKTKNHGKKEGWGNLTIN